MELLKYTPGDFKQTVLGTVTVTHKDYTEAVKRGEVYEILCALEDWVLRKSKLLTQAHLLDMDGFLKENLFKHDSKLPLDRYHKLLVHNMHEESLLTLVEEDFGPSPKCEIIEIDD